LGPVLGKFVGTFQGAGMNTIFRPRNGFKRLNEDNLLEINLTTETLQFMEPSVLGNVPNRGFDDQGDVFLTGIPYQQTVSDDLNPITAKAGLGNKKIDLHFEQGLFMRTPETGSKDGDPNPRTGPTISRMGSIPHGTTINAQDFEPQASGGAKLVIDDVDITPTFISEFGSGPVPFKNMTELGDVLATTKDNMGQFHKLRIPSDLTRFDGTKSITLAMLKNPNLFLKTMNAKKNIVDHWKITVQTKHPDLAGGGVANIAFLVDGTKPTTGGVRGNANAVNMKCTYWVSTVKHQVTIKPGDYTTKDPVFFPDDDTEGVPSPRFQLQLKRKTTEEKKIEVLSTQIQYSQNVTLDFGPLSWPHISVATLVPALPILIPANSPVLKEVK
jgi:hypothetical protein